MRVLLCCIYLFPIPLHSFAILKKNEAHKTRVSVHTDAIVATTASIARLRMRAHVIILPDTEPPVPIHPHPLSSNPIISLSTLSYPRRCQHSHTFAQQVRSSSKKPLFLYSAITSSPLLLPSRFRISRATTANRCLYL